MSIDVNDAEVQRLRSTKSVQEMAEQLRAIVQYFKHPAYKRCREFYAAALLEAKLEQDEEFFVGLFMRPELEKQFNQAVQGLVGKIN